MPMTTILIVYKRRKLIHRWTLLLICLLFYEQMFSRIFVNADFLPPHFLFSSFTAPDPPPPPDPPFPPFPFPSLSHPPMPATAAAEERVFLVLVPQPSSPPSAAAAMPLSALVSSAENALEEVKEGIEEEQRNDALSLAPQTWRVVLGDLCQLPNLRRPSERADTFAECMALESREEEIGTRIGGRTDLGVWKLRKCPVGTAFVPTAQMCWPEQQIRLRHLACRRRGSRKMGKEKEKQGAGIDSECASRMADKAEMWPTVRRKLSLTKCPAPVIDKLSPRRAPSLSSMDQNCVETDENEENGFFPELLEPCPVPTVSRLQRQFQQLGSTVGPCPCQQQSSNCICFQPQTRQPQMYMDCCCEERRQPAPCLCTPIPEQQPPPPPVQQQPPPLPAPPHFVDIGLGQMIRIEIRPPIPISSQAQQNTNAAAASMQNMREDSVIGPMPPRPPPSPPPPVEPPRPCPLIPSSSSSANSVMSPSGNGGAHFFQDMCSWMLDPLVPDPESASHFLQCQPAPFNLLCGRWQRMPCAPSTVFDAREQLCVWDTGGGHHPGMIPEPSPGGAGAWNQPGSQGPAPPPLPVIPTSGKVLQCMCQCRPGGIPLGPCSSPAAGFQCPPQAVCQTAGLATPRKPCTMCCCLYRNRRRSATAATFGSEEEKETAGKFNEKDS